MGIWSVRIKRIVKISLLKIWINMKNYVLNKFNKCMYFDVFSVFWLGVYYCVLLLVKVWIYCVC